jgi:DNA repair exonuclease SbcCD nuclease subunit
MQTIKLPHDKVNFTWITDLHLSAVPPGRREDDYHHAILSKIRFVRELTHKISGVGLCGGDVFHSKNSRSAANSLQFISDVVTEFREFPYSRLFGAVGNHDLAPGDSRESLSKQPLGLLIAAGAYQDITEDPVLFINQDETIKVLVETFPYEHGDAALQRLLATGKRPEGVTHRIGILHAYGEPGNGGGMFGEAIGYNQVQHLDYDFMLWGHDHSRKETVEVGNVTHVHVGSLARAAYDYDELDRKVVTTILSFAKDGIRYKEKEIPVSPLAIAFKSADKPILDVTKSDEIKEFFAAMDEQVGEIESTDPNEIIKALCPVDEPKLLALVRELCDFT